MAWCYQALASSLTEAGHNTKHVRSDLLTSVYPQVFVEKVNKSILMNSNRMRHEAEKQAKSKKLEAENNPIKELTEE